MKIAIYETVHIECVIPLAMLLKGPEHSITFFVHKKMSADIESSLSADEYAAFHWLYIEELNISSLYRLLNNRIYADQYDLLWLNTNDSKHMAFALLKMKYKKMKLVINVHEINNFFRPHISFNIKQMIRLISKKTLSKQADAFILNTGKMKDTVIRYQLTHKPCYIVTPAFYTGQITQQPDTGIFSVVIAGAVDKRRKDYETVLQAWVQFMEKKDPALHVELVLAGSISPHGSAIASICKNNPLLEKSVRIFEHDIPEQRFQQLLANATILLSPQNITTSTSDNTMEEYGLTKTSGNIYDAIRHAKPCVVPRRLFVQDEIESSIIRYSDQAELAAIFSNCSGNKATLDIIYQHAKENSEKFLYETMREKTLTMITAISTLQ